MSEGIVFYNYGTGSAARLVIALHTLRKHWKGNIAVLSDGKESDLLCQNIADDKRLDVRVIDGAFDVRNDRNHHYLCKCRLHEVTPFDVSLYLDADTITVRSGIEDLFHLACKHEFVVPQFSDWRSDSGGHVTKRLRQWQPLYPAELPAAIAFGPAVNTGVFCFTKDSSFCRDWFKKARRGRALFIPDEMSCQVWLHRYPHRIVEWFYNASCKYDDVNDPRVKIVHFHGRKHCREGLPYNGALWVAAYEQAVAENIADIGSWTPGSDRKLRYHLSSVKDARE